MVCFEVDWIYWMILEKLETEVVLRCFGFCATMFRFLGFTSLCICFPQWTNQTWLGNPALIHDDFPVAIKPLPLVMTSSLLLKMAIEIVDLPIINADVPCFSD